VSAAELKRWATKVSVIETTFGIFLVCIVVGLPLLLLLPERKDPAKKKRILVRALRIVCVIAGLCALVGIVGRLSLAPPAFSSYIAAAVSAAVFGFLLFACWKAVDFAARDTKKEPIQPPETTREK
jgi:hypothetical protein